MSDILLRPKTAKITTAFAASKSLAVKAPKGVKASKASKVPKAPAVKGPKAKRQRRNSSRKSAASSQEALFLTPLDPNAPGGAEDVKMAPAELEKDFSSPGEDVKPSAPKEEDVKMTPAEIEKDFSSLGENVIPSTLKEEDVKSQSLLDGVSTDTKPRNKKLAYALGTTPFPNHQHPTPAECEQVIALLTAAHGPADRPDKVPKPDNSVSGCGEVPSVLDAVIRTVLSANTSNSNSARAFQGLVDCFGLIPEDCCDGDGDEQKKSRTDSGTVNWDAVRRADVETVTNAIRSGGMAPTKARRIKGILDTVWEESKKHKQENQHLIKKEPGGEDLNEEEEGDLSLDYIHELPDDEAREKLTSFDGVGPKTASCVMLFCLQRSSFAVDTHVFRLSRYLNWVPAKATRETTYAHLDTKIPDELKYSLHNLLIRHGRTCKHCKAGPKTKAKGAQGKKRTRGESEAVTPTIAAGPSPQEEVEPKMKLKKVWVGTGMMKEVIIEVPDEGQEGEAESEKCVLKDLVRRSRKPKRQ